MEAFKNNNIQLYRKHSGLDRYQLGFFILIPKKNYICASDNKCLLSIKCQSVVNCKTSQVQSVQNFQHFMMS